MKKRVILFGKGSLSLKIADYFRKNSLYDLLCVVPVIPEPEWTESLSEFCRLSGISLVESGEYSDVDFQGKCDLGVSIFYDRIFKKDFLERFEKMINIHPGLLPEYRGLNPINWALKNEEEFHGATIHLVDEGIDTGPIISMVKFKIFPRIEEVRDVYRRTLDYAWILFLHTIEKIDLIEPVVQDGGKAGYHSAYDRRFLEERSDFTREISLGKGDSK
ncbi:hypothetical protein JXA84_07350 [candidate division WOR-3 bacterium]|nr:hypothetical protein [candidate division WOR-3 bacterium]